MNRTSLAAVALASLMLSCAANGSTVAFFNFNTDANASFGMATLTGDTGAGRFSTGGTATTFNGSNVAAGGAYGVTQSATSGNGFTFQFSSAGLQDITLDFDTTRSATGYTTGTVSYATGASPSLFTTFGTFSIATTYAHQTFDFSAIPLLDDQQFANLRISFSSGTNGGTARVDNVLIGGTSTTAVAPLPPAALAGVALLGGLSLARRRLG